MTSDTTTVRLDRALADRHSGTLGGILAPLGAREPAHVTIVVSTASAKTRVGQVLATHLANQLGRLEGVVGGIAVVFEEDSPELLPSIDPRARAGHTSLREAISLAATLASPNRFHNNGVSPQSTAPCISVGIGVPRRSCDIYAAASAWGASVGRKPGQECVASGGSALGAMTAASIAAGEVFRVLRAEGKYSRVPLSLSFDVWNWCHVESLEAADMNAPDTWRLGLPRTTVAGIGAVGSALLLALWTSGCAIEATLVDGDAVANSNLNRYVLFALADLGQLKTERAAQLLHRNGSAITGGSVALASAPVWWSDYMRTDASAIAPLLISTVDTNTARHQLQDALPKLILGASTLGLRAQVDRYDLRSPASRCLKCFNAPEASEPDLLVQRRLLSLEPDAVARHAEESGVPSDTLVAYIADLRAGGTGCAILSGPSLNRLRRDPSGDAFAVSFVSSLAGALLATQLIREAVGLPLLLPPSTRAIFQLNDPTATSNTVSPAALDPDCWCAGPFVRQIFQTRWG